MKREVNNLDFFQCPVVEVGGDPRGNRGIQETGLPLIPTDGDGLKENTDFIPKNERLKKVLKIAAVVALAALFVGIGIAIFAGRGPDFFKIQPPINP